MTFFPYFLLEKFEGSDIRCAGLDVSYNPIFEGINRSRDRKVSFVPTKLQDLNVSDNSVDVI